MMNNKCNEYIRRLHIFWMCRVDSWFINIHNYWNRLHI